MRLIKFLLIVFVFLYLTSGHKYSSLVDTYFYKRRLYPSNWETGTSKKSNSNLDVKRILQDLLFNLKSTPLETTKKKLEKNEKLEKLNFDNVQDLYGRLLRMI